VQELAEYDFIAIGGPTEYRTASKPMSIFLNRLKQANIKGKYGFAFDTRVDSFWSGSAGRLIENELKTLGLRIVKPHTSAYVIHRERFGEKSSGTSREETREERKARKAREKEERRASAVLVEGMEELFENLGNEIGRILALSS
jgi:multimeric flavodoxin WrbA